MQLIQFEAPGAGRRLGVVDEGRVRVRDLTSVQPQVRRTVDLFDLTQRTGASLEATVGPWLETRGLREFDYETLLRGTPESGGPFLHPPVDAEDPSRVLVTGTGLTHLGGMAARNRMHAEARDANEPVTDSRKMFERGLRGGKPAAGVRGAAPEWFYKGNGTILRGHRHPLDVPSFAGDGGEEAEIVGCYVIDRHGRPRRLGCALGNEWSDHPTEKINYLYLAPSKLRTCAVGPELATDFPFDEVRLRCTVRRGGHVLYDSGELLSGERHMCHSLANCEDHHFKFPQHRRPGDVHLHYFGTSRLSYGSREWTYEDGDEVRIDSPEFGAALVNVVRAERPSETPVTVQRAW